MPVDLQQFAERLVQSGLFSAEELAAFEEGLPPEKRPQEARDLARELILADRLTRFQAEAVYRGRTKGLVLGEYVVLERIGAGGMGEVLKARHRTMDRVVALKVLPAKAVKSPDAVRRFHREVRAAAKLNHPNIVTAHDAGECEGIHYLVSEYVDGPDLARLVKQHGPLPVDQAVECIVQAARGLEYAHDHGVIHRDIKPGNLLLERSSRHPPGAVREGSPDVPAADGTRRVPATWVTVKILDMGLARIEQEIGPTDATGSERLTDSGQVMGTCDYMAPEQAEDTHAADHRADIYSLGCTFYRLLTGTPPYSGDTLIKILLAHREAPIPSLCEVRPDVPEAVDAVLRKMLAKRPEDRHQTMGEVIAELEACRQGQGPSAPLQAEGPSDSALSLFLKQLGGGRTTGTQQRAATRVEDTMPSRVEEETGAKKGISPISAEHAQPGKSKRRQKWDLSPFSRRNLIRHIAIAGGAALSLVLLGLLIAVLRRGNDTSPLPTEGEGSEATAPGQGDAPPIAKAPFTAQQARWYQKQWADYLGLPVEWTNSIDMTFVLIPPGEFGMGTSQEEVALEIEEAKERSDPESYIRLVPAEAPRHRVRITRPFYLGMYEVRQAEYEQIMGTNPSAFSARGKDAEQVAGIDTSGHPVEMVFWEEAKAFCEKLAEVSEEEAGAIYRLPTEAEWEYACRAGTTTKWVCGNDSYTLEDYGWVCSNSAGRTHTVGKLKPNGFGLFDVHGNVFEWCWDAYHPGYYENSPQDDPTGPVSSPSHVNRGGAWVGPVGRCRSACRYSFMDKEPYHALGFRVACEIPADPMELKKFAAAIEASKPEEEPQKDKPATVRPRVKVKPLPIEIKPDPKAWEIKPGEPLSEMALVRNPTPIQGVRSWTLESAGQRAQVMSVAFSPDGRMLATAGCDATVRVWNLASGRLLRALVAQAKRAVAVAWSPDGRYLASRSYSGETSIWDVEAGRLVRVLPGLRAGPSFLLCWSPDGHQLTSGGTMHTSLQVWDICSEEEPLLLEGGGAKIWPGGWLADGETLVCGGDAKRVTLWDTRSGRLRRSIEATEAIGILAVSPDGTRIASAGIGSEPWHLQVWNAETGEARCAPKPLPSYALAMAWSPEGDTLAVAVGPLQYSRVLFCNVESGEISRTMPDPLYGWAVRSLAYAPDGKTLAAGNGDATVRIYEARSDRLLRPIPGHPRFDVAFAPNGKTLAYAKEDGPAERVRVWVVGSEWPPRLLEGPIPPHRTGFPGLSLSDKTIAAARDRGHPAQPRAYVWALETGKRLATLSLPDDVESLARFSLSPDGKMLAVGAHHPHIVDSVSGKPLMKLEGTALGGFTWSPDGTSLAVGVEKEVKVLDRESGRTQTTLSGCPSPVVSVAWCPLGKTVAAAGSEQEIFLWDVDSGQLLRKLEHPHNRTPSLSWSSDGRNLVSTSQYGVCVWDADTGKQLLTERSFDAYDNFSVSPDCRFVLREVGNVVRFQDPADSRVLMTLMPLAADQDVLVSPEGHYRGTPDVEKELVYVVLTDSGEQLTLTPEEFARKYGWQNDPAEVAIQPQKEP